VFRKRKMALAQAPAPSILLSGRIPRNSIFLAQRSSPTVSPPKFHGSQSTKVPEWFSASTTSHWPKAAFGGNAPGLPPWVIKQNVYAQKNTGFGGTVGPPQKFWPVRCFPVLDLTTTVAGQTGKS